MSNINHDNGEQRTALSVAKLSQLAFYK